MISNHIDDEFVAVRVQDPRVQNEGSWNSYVDYKIFLHTNSKAFTAKTSCVRRRYSEFVWLKKKLQKNAGLVPVPELPGKSIFSFSNEDFLEKRRKGLQAFLDKVLHLTVCLSDSQLHLFLQTQLPVSHIEDCVQGLTPYSVTDAILTYASSNRGLAQAQEEDSIKEPGLTISYESMESPAPHQPCMQTNVIFNPELVAVGYSDPLEDIVELGEEKLEKKLHKNSTISVSQRSDSLEAIAEDEGAAQVTFYLGETTDDTQSLGSVEQTALRGCFIQTPVEVHSPMGAGFEDSCGVEPMQEEEKVISASVEEKTLLPDTEKNKNIIKSESEVSVISEEISSTENSVMAIESDSGSKEICYESNISGFHKGNDGDTDSLKEAERNNKDHEEFDSDLQVSLQRSDGLDCAPDMCDAEPEIHSEADEQEEKSESDEDSESLQSSNESIVKCNKEESLFEETKSSHDEVENWSEDSDGNIHALHSNGCLEEKASHSEDEEDRDTSVSKSAELLLSAADVDLKGSSDFSILQTLPGEDKSTFMKRDVPSSLSVDTPEEVEVH